VVSFDSSSNYEAMGTLVQHKGHACTILMVGRGKVVT